MATVFRGVRGVGLAVVGFALIVGLLWVLIQVGGFLRQEQMDVNREITQHSQQYIETKRSLLLSLVVDAEAASGDQRSAIVHRFCEEYSFVDFDVPATVDEYAGRNC